MLRRHVQCVEAVPLVLDLGPFDNSEAHPREDLFQTIADRGERMAAAQPRSPSRQRDVDRAGGHAIASRGLVLRPPRFDRLFQLVRPAANLLLLVGRRRPTHLHPRRDDAVLALRGNDRAAWASRADAREGGLDRHDQALDGFLARQEVGHDRQTPASDARRRSAVVGDITSTDPRTDNRRRPDR